MGRGPAKHPKTGLTLSPNDAEFVATSVAGTLRDAGNGHGTPPVDFQSQLAGAILEQRLDRLTKQNKKLDFELLRHEQQLADMEVLKRDVQRMNAIVRQSLHMLANGLAEQIALMSSPDEIRQLLRTDFAAVFADLYDGRRR